MVPGGYWLFLVVLGGSWALVQIFEANDPIRPSNEPKVLARVGLQRPGALVQIVDADDPIFDSRTYQKCWRAWDFSGLGRLCNSSMQMIYILLVVGFRTTFCYFYVFYGIRRFLES